jgi:hypothetical protein
LLEGICFLTATAIVLTMSLVGCHAICESLRRKDKSEEIER